VNPLDPDLRALAFFLCGAFVVWITSRQQRAEEQLRQMRDELETKVRERTAALSRSEAYLTEAQRLSQTGSWAHTPDTGELLYCSEELCRIFGFDPRQTMPTREMFNQRFNPDDLEKLRQLAQKAVEQKSGYVLDGRIVLPDGTNKLVQIIGHPIVNTDGDIVEYIGTTIDVTERKKAEEALQEAQTALAHVTRVTTLGEVAGSIAHEVNQPLTAIANNANACLGLLSTGSADLEEMRQALEDIVNDAERGGAIIQRIRGMARHSAPRRTPVWLADVVNDIIVLTAGESAARGIVISTEVAPFLPMVQADRVQLQQVLLNLVVNGMDAMNSAKDPERRLEILGLPDKHDGQPAVRISVRDRGIGLKSGETDKLFQAFYTTKPQGLGLGLAICRSIIQAHGGRLWAEANNGPGATFAFRLPAIADAEYHL
jgi:PAS domain S-box-containing protein